MRVPPQICRALSVWSSIRRSRPSNYRDRFAQFDMPGPLRVVACLIGVAPCMHLQLNGFHAELSHLWSLAVHLEQSQRLRKARERIQFATGLYPVPIACVGQDAFGFGPRLAFTPRGLRRLPRWKVAQGFESSQNSRIKGPRFRRQNRLIGPG